MKNLACLMALFVAIYVFSIAIGASGHASIYGGNWLFVIPAFLIFGILLGLTPCMMPIILMMTSICRGSGKSSWLKLSTFSHIVIFIVTLTVTYILVGLLASSLGIYLRAYIQNVMVIGILSIFFLALGLSSLGLFKIHFPWLSLHSISMMRKYHGHNSYLATIVMGVICTLLAAPCLSAPLIGVITMVVYIADIKFGCIAFFCIGLGLGSPLIAIYTIDKDLLQKAGEWQHNIREFLGIILIGISIWLLESVIAASIIMYFWAALAIFVAAFMGAFARDDININLTKDEKVVCNLDGESLPEKNIKIKNISALTRMVSFMILIYGIILFMGALLGNDNPLNPLKNGVQIIQQIPNDKGE